MDLHLLYEQQEIQKRVLANCQQCTQVVRRVLVGCYALTFFRHPLIMIRRQVQQAQKRISCRNDDTGAAQQINYQGGNPSV